MTWQEIADMSPDKFNKLSQSDLKKYTQILASAGNKRLKRAQQQGFTSPSIEAVQQRGKFSTAGKNVNQLRNEFMRAKRFMESKTGTLSEFKKFRSESIQALNEKAGINITPAQFDKFWRAYEELKKQNPSLAAKGLKYAVLEEIDKLQKDDRNIDVDNIVNTIQNNLNQIYENQQEQTAQAELNAAEIPF